jgi:WD40 repeat protein
VTIAYDTSSGDVAWTRRYGVKDQAGAGWALTVSPDGSTVFVTGYSDTPTGNEDYATIAYDATDGTVLWMRRYDGPQSKVDTPTTIGVTTDGSKVIVSGTSVGLTSSFDFATIEYDANTGAVVWLDRYDGPFGGIDGANALVVSPDGTSVYVTGASDGQNGQDDFATVAYST